MVPLVRIFASSTADLNSWVAFDCCCGCSSALDASGLIASRLRCIRQKCERQLAYRRLVDPQWCSGVTKRKTKDRHGLRRSYHIGAFKLPPAGQCTIASAPKLLMQYSMRLEHTTVHQPLHNAASARTRTPCLATTRHTLQPLYQVTNRYEII